MENNFRDAKIKNLNITEKGDIVQPQAKEIKNITGISEEDLEKLIKALKEIVKDSRMDKTVANELREAIRNVDASDKSTWRQHVQNFLNNAANIATLTQLGLKLSEFIR